VHIDSSAGHRANQLGGSGSRYEWAFRCWAGPRRGSRCVCVYVCVCVCVCVCLYGHPDAGQALEEAVGVSVSMSVSVSMCVCMCTLMSGWPLKRL